MNTMAHKTQNKPVKALINYNSDDSHSGER